MTSKQSPQAIDPPLNDADEPRYPPSPRLVAATVGWFLGWPFVFFACISFFTPGNELEAWLVGAGSVLWLVSAAGVCGLVFAMTETRWPATKPILKALSFLFSVLRAFQSRHSS